MEENGQPGAEESDSVLVDQALAGDVGAYDTLVVRYQQRLYALIYNMTSNHEDTNDLLMEVFHKAYRSLSKYKKNSSFYTWIYRVAVNHTLNFLQKNKKRRKDMSLNDLSMDSEMEREFQDLKAQTGDEAAELDDLKNKLNESLQKLSEEHRTVVVLYDIDGMSHGDIAKILKCSEGTVRSRLHYAHKNLQQFLREYRV